MDNTVSKYYSLLKLLHLKQFFQLENLKHYEKKHDFLNKTMDFCVTLKKL